MGIVGYMKTVRIAIVTNSFDLFRFENKMWGKLKNEHLALLVCCFDSDFFYLCVCLINTYRLYL